MSKVAKTMNILGGTNRRKVKQGYIRGILFKNSYPPYSGTANTMVLLLRPRNHGKGVKKAHDQKCFGPVRAQKKVRYQH